MEERNIKIRYYNKVYTIEPKIYKFWNVKSPVGPIETVPAMIFLGTMFIMYLIPIPLVGSIKYIGIPYLVTRLLRKTKKDGKTLFKYYLGYIEYLIIKNKVLERFKISNEIKEIQFFKY